LEGELVNKKGCDHIPDMALGELEVLADYCGEVWFPLHIG
ncbi:unnamed protein product, partial [marine sediment metagenome]